MRVALDRLGQFTRADEEDLERRPAEQFDAIAGGGVEAVVDGRPVLVGTSRLLGDRGVALEDAAQVLAREEARGRTAVLVAVGGTLAGTLSMADTVKPDARQAVAELEALGMHVVMLTGDAERTARAVAAEVGIQDVRARVRPGEKADRVRELQRGGGAWRSWATASTTRPP
ncbi:MAG: HAD-IC family P-type ATPase [Acidobacteria bacterium]|nr:HAD-IC family P-type ATPase [Acidobacteriota bacterium]